MMTTTAESRATKSTGFRFDLLSGAATEPVNNETNDRDGSLHLRTNRGLSRAQLQRQLQRLGEMVDSLNRTIARLQPVDVPAVESGLDFYDEVRRFQTELIIRALKVTGGSQVKAARLLKMNHTTLNMKIKNLGIEFSNEITVRT